MWNDIPYTVFDTATLDGFKGAVNRWMLTSVVCQFPLAQVFVGLRKQFINISVFSTWACAAGFNNNNNNINKNNHLIQIKYINKVPNFII